MSKITILIVEDEAIVAADLAGKLGRLGYEVAGTAAQGEEAVAMACRLRPHLVLMDISLEGPMDGIEAAEAIRRQHDVPVIYLTAHSDPATLARAKVTGPFGYILKPFEERELATQIEMAIYRHQADRQLRQQREWLRVTLTSIGDAVVATDASGRITFVNPVAESLTGWKAEEAAGQPVQCVFRIVNEQTGEPMEEPVARVLREGRAVELANHAALVTKDDRTVPIEDSAAPILDAAGQVIGAVLVFHDVADKRRAEETLRRSESRYRELVQHANSAIIRWSRDGTITFFNEYAQAFFGYGDDELIGQHVNVLVPERESTGANLTGLFQDIVDHPDHYVNNVNENVCRDGRRVWMSWTNRAIRDAHGQVTEILAVASDISERKRAEETLRQSEEQYRLLFAANPNPMFVFDEETMRFLAVNDAAVRHYGWSREEFLATTILDIRPPEDRALAQDSIQRNRGAREARIGIVRHCRKDGTVMDMEITVSSISFAGRPGRLCSMNDITEREREEEERQKLASVVRHSREFISMATLDGKMVFINEAGAEMVGLSAEEVEQTHILQVIPGHLQDKVTNEVLPALREKGLWEGELQYRNLKTGRLMDVYATTFTIRAPGQGTPLFLANTSIDITVRKQAEAALRESEARFRNVFDHAATGIAVTDCAGRFVQCNAAYCRLTGYTQAELAAMEFPTLIHPEDREHNLGFIRRLLGGELPSFEIENRYVHKDGSLVWVHKHVSLLRDDRGQSPHIVALVTDTTERKRTEDALRFLGQCGVSGSGGGFFQELARYLAQTLDMDYVCIDRLEEGHLSAQTLAVFHNGQFEDNVSYTLKDTPCGDVVGQRICCFPQNVRGLFPKDAVLQDMRAESYLGTTLWSGQGKPIGLIAVIGRQPLAETRLAESLLQLVAVRAAGELERQQAEGNLRQSEERLRRAQEIAHLGSWDLDVVNDRLTWSDEVYRVFGLQPQEFQATYEAFLEAVHPDDRAAVDAAYSSSLREGRDSYEIEHRVVRKSDGEVRFVHEKCEHFRDDSGRIIRSVGMVHDITERKRAEAERQKFVSLADQSTEFIGVCGMNFVPFYVNEAGRRMVGLDSLEVAMRTPVKEFFFSEDQRFVLEEFFPRVLREGRAEVEIRFRHFKTGEPLWMIYNVFYVRGTEGNPVGLATVSRNITQRKRAEEALVRAKAAAESANRAKSEFLANMSHEIRTPMTAILGFTDLLLDHDWTDEERREYLGIVRENGGMLLQLINDILDLSKIEAEKMGAEKIACAPTKIVDDVLALMRVRADEKSIGLTASYDPALPPMIYTDPVRLRQILVNLVGNAVKFTKHGGVEIRVSCLAGDGAPPRLLFAVADTGIGIPREALSTIFEPFAQADGSLSRKFGGTGLGLAISRRLAALLGGALEVKSELGRGSVFTLSIDPGPLDDPVLVGSHSRTSQEPASSHFKLPPGRVLVVEDTMAGRRVVQIMLQKMGLTVETAETGLEACRVAYRSLAESQPYDVILMDVQMPEMDGYEATRQLRRQGWRGPIVALTAHAMEGDRDKCLAAGCDDYLAKPISRDKLVEVLSRFLGPSNEGE